MGYRCMKPADLIKAKRIISCSVANLDMLLCTHNLMQLYKNDTIIEQTIMQLSYVSTLLGCTDYSDSDSDYEFDSYTSEHIKPNHLSLSAIIQMLEKLRDTSSCMPSNKTYGKLEKIRHGLDSIL